MAKEQQDRNGKNNKKLMSESQWRGMPSELDSVE